jgi:hypothetical protein
MEKRHALEGAPIESRESSETRLIILTNWSTYSGRDFALGRLGLLK